MKSLIVRRVVSFCILFIVVTNIWGSEDESVVKRIANLEMQVADLNSRVLQLEKKLEDCTTQHESVIQNVPAGKDTWRKLKKKMSKEQVIKLLGEPAKIDNFGSFEVWNYDNYSKVQFDDNGYVTGWHEPE
jgi:hypothetical protein